MDEIDAALDFRNVSIIANYIKDPTSFHCIASNCKPSSGVALSNKGGPGFTGCRAGGLGFPVFGRKCLESSILILDEHLQRLPLMKRALLDIQGIPFLMCQPQNPAPTLHMQLHFHQRLLQERTKNAQFIVISLRNHMRLEQRLFMCLLFNVKVFKGSDRTCK